jgi:hypothetical protein
MYTLESIERFIFFVCSFITQPAVKTQLMIFTFFLLITLQRRPHNNALAQCEHQQSLGISDISNIMLRQRCATSFNIHLQDFQAGCQKDQNEIVFSEQDLLASFDGLVNRVNNYKLRQSKF